MGYEHQKLVEFGKKLLDIESLEDGLLAIAKYSKKIMNAERCSIFMYDADSNELWTSLADGTDRIVIPSDIGMIGHTLRVKKPILENDPYGNDYFLSDVDMKTGYYTQNLLTAPIFNSNREVAGVLELLNKKDGFTKDDIEFIRFFAHYLSAFLELRTLYRGKDLE